MKTTIMNMAIASLSCLMRIILPFGYLFRRIYYPALLRADIPGMHVSVQCDGRVYLSGTRKISIGKRSRLGSNIELRTAEKGSIDLGNDIRINRGCTLVSYSRIVVGDYAIIGEYVSIRDANHGMDINEPMRYQQHTCAPVHIGRDVWIGRGSCILPGVSIGDGCVIGANSVVTVDIPAYSIAAGVPAKVIKKRD